MKIDFTGRTAMVTGAARGIGAAIAQTLAAAGASVIVADVDESGAAAHAEVLGRMGARATAVALDITDESSVAQALNTVRPEFGDVAILVNNAGISAPAPTLDMSLESWRRVLDVNLTGAFVCSKAVLPHMQRARWGRIVTVVSFAGKSSPIYADNASYAASKAGLIGLIHNTAIEFAADGITINGVAPGIVETEMLRSAHSEERRAELARKLPVGRFTRPDEVASLIAFLASDFAGSITGEIVNINGGLYLD